MSFRAIVSNFARVRHARGWRAAFRAIRERLDERYFENYFGIETRGFVASSELGFATTESHAYVATSYAGIFGLLRRLAPARSDVFLDYGCGKGRALVVAATFPFSQAIGIELSASLATDARYNLQRARGRFQCPRVEVWQGDATGYVVPDDATIAYFNNPFSGAVLAKVLEQLRASLARRPRVLRLACTLPADSAFERTLDNTPDLISLERRSGPAETHDRIFQWRV